ncbi:hypothetical protein [Streptomyces naphthomycinicus]|uniref:hypothetical protein n=1 Tax=Streptomyces naphthomycinicus TaxID=2872625 RepID=UPI001CEC487E|nr:hypothetical protein [Streptomyces sp. TML10]
MTQIAGEEGMGLMNGVERYAGAVWERHCPDEEVPPVWVEWQLWPEGARQESHFTLGDGIPEFNGVRSGRP